MNIAGLLDQHFPMHGNWQGLSLGNIVVVWLSYILSQGDHRLNAVQGWVAGIILTLSICLKSHGLRELDFSDDRLGIVLDKLGQDAQWEAYEIDQCRVLLRVYELKPELIRIDSTTAKSYVSVSEGGLLQFGHSKEHRADLPQLKINQSVLDPLGMPLTTTIVSGECADDPLYVPEMRKVQACIEQKGLLFVGDCKMSALSTRAYVAAEKNYYLSPLSAVQMPQKALHALLEAVWTGEQPLTAVYRPPETKADKPEHIADSFCYCLTLCADYETQPVEWQEQRFVVRSLKHAAAQEKALIARLEKAEKALAALTLAGRGRKCLDEDALKSACSDVVTRHDVGGLLIIEILKDSEISHKRAYAGRAAQSVTKTKLTVHSSRNATAIANAVRYLGWRVFVSNNLALSPTQVVLAYREQYIIERGYNRFRGKLLGITPLCLSSTTRIKGLIRLLSIGLRVLCLLEFTVRKTLHDNDQMLDHIYDGNPKRATAKPTAEIMLKTFKGITINVIDVNGAVHGCITPLNSVQARILTLLGLPIAIYQKIAEQSGELFVKMSEP